MLYRIDQSVFRLAPSFARAVVIARNVDNSSELNSALYEAFRFEVKRLEREPAAIDVELRLSAWKEAYRHALPSRVRDARPSMASLIRRIRSGKGMQIPFVSSIVCVSNLVALRFVTPSGPVDRNLVKGSLTLGIATREEQFQPIGSSRSETILPGEIIYSDEGTGHILCRAWNSRGGTAGQVTRHTTTAIIDIDSLSEVLPHPELECAASTMTELLRVYCGGDSEIRYLNSQDSEIEFA